jgi:hypothetical protein
MTDQPKDQIATPTCQWDGIPKQKIEVGGLVLRLCPVCDQLSMHQVELGRGRT